jgi:hypothetical protein
MYQRSRLAQDEEFAFLPSEYSNGGGYTFSTPSNGAFALQPTPSYPAIEPYSPPVFEPLPTITPAPAPADSGWTWQDIWKPVSQVLTTGAEVFSKVYPAVTGTAPVTSPQTGYPSPYPQTPKPSAPTGYQYIYNPATRSYQLQPLTQQAGITASPYFWPVTLGLGALLFLTAGRKGRA